jgi:hypothetical protein
MSIRSEAQENLRVIRQLMEKATVYRAISAPGALIGGTCSVALLVFALIPRRSVEIVPFLGAWLGVLAFTSAANCWLLRRDAMRRGETFISPGMRLALRAMLPALLGGGACSFVQGDGGPVLIASLWVLFYGVSLLAAAHFAPKSINWLGRAFFVAGFTLIFVGAFVADWWRGANQTAIAHGIMGATFGAFHLVYAACTWPRKMTPAGGKP